MNSWTTMPACGKEPFFIDWSRFYTRHSLDPAVDLITSSTWEVTGGTKGTEFVNTPETGVVLSGGTSGAQITAENTIEINGGTYRSCQTIVVGVK